MFSRRDIIAVLLAENPNNKGSARIGRGHVTPEPPPPIPGGNAAPLKQLQPYSWVIPTVQCVCFNKCDELWDNL